MTDKKTPQTEEYTALDATKPITSNELEYILDVNRKAISIYNEVSQQNEEILEVLEELKDTFADMKTKVDDTSTVVKELKDTIDDIKSETKDTKELASDQKTKISDIDKNLLRLVVIFSTVGVGTIIQFVMQLLHK